MPPRGSAPLWEGLHKAFPAAVCLASWWHMHRYYHLVCVLCVGKLGRHCLRSKFSQKSLTFASQAVISYSLKQDLIYLKYLTYYALL